MTFLSETAFSENVECMVKNTMTIKILWCHCFNVLRCSNFIPPMLLNYQYKDNTVKDQYLNMEIFLIHGYSHRASETPRDPQTTL